MKRYIFVAIFVSTMMHCYGQSFSFMGVDIDQSYISFNRSISQKITFKSENEGWASYYGVFAGISNCGITVDGLAGGKVSKVRVDTPLMSQDVANRLVASYTSKYGKPYHEYVKRMRNNYGPEMHYLYMVGIHKIEIKVQYFESFKEKQSYLIIITYIPRGYINESSNVKIKTGDI